jgi:hypothetical protein
MTDVASTPGVTNGEAGQDVSAAYGASSHAGKRRKSKSMHEGIAVWCDCCSCEAEPYWVAIAAEMGIEPGSDYEDTNS